MERLTERLPDGRNIIRNYYSHTFNANYGNFVEGEAIDKLSDYEDLDEQGLLLRLPCKVGDTVYVLSECKNVDLVLDGTMTDFNGEPGTATGWYCPYELNDKCPHFDCEDCEDVKNKTAVFEDIVDCIYCDETGFVFHCQNTDVYGYVGKYIFLTKQEAEQKLKEMNEHDGE